MSINEQKREGLASVFTIHCNGCNEDFTLATSLKVKGPSGHQYWENNLAAVSGQTSTGGGHVTLQETMAVLGLSTMTNKSFMATERRIGECWWNHLQESMKSAGEMEKTITISKQDITREFQLLRSLLMEVGASGLTNIVTMPNLALV